MPRSRRVHRRRGHVVGGREELATLILALVGFIRANNDDQSLINDISPVAKLFHRPYVRAMFAFILAQDGNDLQYECVLVRCSLLCVSFGDACLFEGRTTGPERQGGLRRPLSERSTSSRETRQVGRRSERERRSAGNSSHRFEIACVTFVVEQMLHSGLRPSGCELIQRYLDQTNDIRTAALLAIYVPEDVHQECSYVHEWIEG